ARGRQAFAARHPAGTLSDNRQLGYYSPTYWGKPLPRFIRGGNRADRDGTIHHGEPPVMLPASAVAFDAPPTLTSAVVRHIQELMLRGEFPPGSALPEIPLARRLDTSRGTVREALRELAELGLVELQARRGAVVAQLSPQRAREIFSLRALLESF